MFTHLIPLTKKSGNEADKRALTIFQIIRDSVKSILEVPDTDIITVLHKCTVKRTDPYLFTLEKSSGKRIIPDVILSMHTSDKEKLDLNENLLRETLERDWKKFVGEDLAIEIWIDDFRVWGFVGLQI